MKKKIVLTLLIVSSPDVCSQVGINTPDPEITLLDTTGDPSQHTGSLSI